MKKIIEQLAKKANIQLSKPANERLILKVEQKLGVTLPEDYKEFLNFSNGLSATDVVEPTFLPIEEIDYLKNIETYTIEGFSIEGIEDIGKQLEQSILIAGKDEEQYFLLIPPNQDYKKWKYWKFAAWIPGEHEFNNLEAYFSETLSFLEEINE